MSGVTRIGCLQWRYKISQWHLEQNCAVYIAQSISIGLDDRKLIPTAKIKSKLSEKKKVVETQSQVFSMGRKLQFLALGYV